MRRLFFMLLVAFSSRVFAEEPTYDQQLAVTAAQAYVESYLRLHPQEHLTDLDWDHPKIQFVPRSVGSVSGYIAVFFPEQHGTGAGHAYFQLGGLPGHIFVVEWGVTGALVEEMTKFSQAATNGTLPSVSCN